MPNELTISLNGQQRTLEGLESPSAMPRVINALELKDDRIAVEHNGQIVPRIAWPDAMISSGDRLEIVHFVGGGLEDNLLRR